MHFHFTVLSIVILAGQALGLEPSPGEKSWFNHNCNKSNQGYSCPGVFLVAQNGLCLSRLFDVYTLVSCDKGTRFTFDITLDPKWSYTFQILDGNARLRVRNNGMVTSKNDQQSKPLTMLAHSAVGTSHNMTFVSSFIKKDTDQESKKYFLKVKAGDLPGSLQATTGQSCNFFIWTKFPIARSEAQKQWDKACL